MHLDPAWAAVTVSAVTVAANVFGITWAGRTQRRLAHIERLGDRRTDVYVELLRWITKAEEEVIRSENFLAIVEALRLPQELELQTLAFASENVNHCVKKFQDSWVKAKDAVAKNEPRIREVLRDIFNGKQSSDAIERIVPEYKAAHEATDRIKLAIRMELLGRYSFTERLRSLW